MCSYSWCEFEVVRNGSGGTGNETDGYITGGAPELSSFDKITYSTDTTASVPSGGDLSVGRKGVTAVSPRTNDYIGALSGPAKRFSDNEIVTPDAGYLVVVIHLQEQ